MTNVFFLFFPYKTSALFQFILEAWWKGGWVVGGGKGGRLFIKLYYEF